MNISGCACVVTGAASGLGEAAARRLAAAGGKVALFDLEPARGRRVAEEIGGVFAEVDVTDAESVGRGLDIAEQAHGTARVLVNCAGVIIAQKTTSRGVPHVLEDFRRVVDINLTGTFNCIRLVVTRMVADEAVDGKERGVVINTASVSAFDGQTGQAAYAASKAGVAGMTLPLSRDLSRHGIRVVTVAPGIFQTPLLTGLPQAVQESLAATVPFPPRPGEPDEFASLVQHICENGYLNGTTIRLDGAIRMTP